MSTPTPTKDPANLMSIMKQIKACDIQYVRFEQHDLYGQSRSKTVPIEFFTNYVKNGLNFYGGLLGCDIQSRCPEGTGYAEEVTYADHCVQPDLSTFTVLPWVRNTAAIMVDPYWYDGTPAMASPRLLLKQILSEYDKLGYTVRMGYEFEFYVLDADTKKPVYDNQPIFVTQRNNFNVDFTYDLMEKMRQADIHIITQNSEHGPGQQEINLFHRDGIAAADEAITFKNGIKEIAAQHGYVITSMTKPIIDKSASGAHFHVSLIDKATGENAFYDACAEKGLSAACKSFIAGCIAHARANTVFSAPTINCYKRYRVNSFAPNTATWGYENRTVGLRIKGVRGSSTHIENRLGCAASNPYLMALSTLAAGLIGIRKELAPPKDVDHIAYGDPGLEVLPTNLDGALAAFKADTELHEVLGPEFVKLYTRMKEHDIETAAAACTDYGTPGFYNRVDSWEWDEFLELL